MQLQRSIGNRAVASLLSSRVERGASRGAYAAGAAIQLKRARPADAELLKLISERVVPDKVIAGIVSDNERAEEIWKYVNKEYDESKTSGTKNFSALEKQIGEYKRTKARIVQEKSLKRALEKSKLQKNYVHKLKRLGDGLYRVNSLGFDPDATVPPKISDMEDQDNYSNHYDVKTGTMHAKWNFATRDKARTAGKGTNNSEILWGQYEMAAEENFKKEIDKETKVKEVQKNLSKIIRSSVINPSTKATVYAAYPDNKYWHKGDNMTWSPGTDDFDAILGTPNVKSTPHLLMDHMDELEKTIDTIETKNSFDVEVNFKPIS